MSLINKMLQDLEERKSGADLPDVWQGQVRAAPQVRPRGSKRIVALGLIAVLAAGAAGAAWWFGTQQEPVAAMSQPVVPQAAPLSLKLDHSPSVLPAAAAESLPSMEVRDETVPLDATNPPASTGDALAVSQKDKDPGVAALPSAANQLPVPVSLPSRPSRSAEPAAGVETEPAAKAVSDTKRAQAVAPAVSAKNKPQPGDTIEHEELAPMKVSKQVKELTPAQHAENEYRRALTLIEQGRHREAHSLLEQALHIDSRHAAARQTLAALLIDGKRPDEAMRILSDGLSVDRAQPGLAMMLARLQVDRQNARAAIDTLQSSLPYANERADYRAFLAALLQREARHKEAVEHYLAALRKTPNNGIWWMGIAISLQAEARIPEARDAYSRARASGTLSPDLLAFVEQKLSQLR